MAADEIGLDDWPRWADQSADRTRQTIAQQTIAHLEARWRNGDRTAAALALWECYAAGLPPPSWVVEAMDELTAAAMAEEEKRARLDWRKHQVRWQEITELRERSPELQARWGDDRGKSLEKARAAIAEALAGTFAEASESMMKFSYELVEAAGGETATFETYQAELRRRSRSKKPWLTCSAAD
jgi:hypothetical protein